MKVKVIDNFLNENLFKELNDLSINNEELSFSTSKNWGENLDTGPGKIAIYSLHNANGVKSADGEKGQKFTDDIVYPLIDLFKKEHGLLAEHIDFHYWNHNSYINFHNDHFWHASATLYLNNNWPIKNGGLFVWDENEIGINEQTNNSYEPTKFKAVKPIRNRCVINNGNILHAVTPVISKQKNIIRRTIQFRFKKI